MARKADDEPVTWGDLRRVYKKLDGRIDEAFDAVNANDDKQAGFWDEHEDKIGRLTRSVARLKKQIEEEE